VINVPFTIAKSAVNYQTHPNILSLM